MGIRNLAYCHLRTRLDRLDTPGQKKYSNVEVIAWERMDVSKGVVHEVNEKDVPVAKAKAGRRKQRKEGDDEEELIPSAKESFDPATYAERTYAFVSRILEKHRPTHILIERQRFRTGGGPSVQEWALRVGMFEFMLYATLQALKSQGVHSSAVEPVLPTAVNRYWISQIEERGFWSDFKPTSSSMKQYKIDAVKNMLRGEKYKTRHLQFSSQAQGTASKFLPTQSGSQKAPKTPKTSSSLKLDDLSDCLLQGLAWIAWQENLRRLYSIYGHYYPYGNVIEPHDPLNSSATILNRMKGPEIALT
ncbi:uncharacterized protein HMPREF1541_04761 [Cyphellophora europaea CBS 101466]|uniref:Mitochondrial resolvase Ydc2 catalytic domain-containing protein n=1 Tax=Cyphellophora europaea (strain CBS 101466) TaxID=1220924 RepID=W2RXU0_CYPE1|nr:uncharacterized protein HMPREF1541_04761 [Cyphellophora europaea CBS 101466]ETN40484.1 hypothetical protein HMPREF1541_04761 [Cyphellophora europaea CBS 101466]